MTVTPGSAARTDTARDAVRSPLLAHRAAAALGERGRLPLLAGVGSCALPAEPRGLARPPAARPGHSLLRRAGLDRGARPDRPARRPARAAPHGARARRIRPRRSPLAGRAAAGAAGSLQRGPEDQHGDHSGADPALSLLRGAALARRARHALPLRKHRDPARRPDVHLADCSSATSTWRSSILRPVTRCGGSPSGRSARSGRHAITRSGSRNSV